MTGAGSDPSGRPAPTVSAVVVNYNYEAYLGEAVESLLAQSPPFDEVLVVDDGSTDGSVAVAERYAPRVRLVRKANGGQLSACLAGARACRSDYVYFLDADDRAKQGLVSAVARALADLPVKVQFPLEAVDGDGKPTGSVFPTFPVGYDAARMVEDNSVTGFYTCPPTSGNVYRRQQLLDLDASALDLRDFVDGPPTLVLPYLGEIVSLHEPWAQYRLHGGNHSQWYRPTPELLQGEIRWFHRRWAQACAVMGWDEPPFADVEPAYVLERRLMILALEGRSWTGGAALAFARRTAQANVPPQHVAALVLWAALLVLPSRRLRRRLVTARRSPSDRPAALRWLVRLLRRLRR